MGFVRDQPYVLVLLRDLECRHERIVNRVDDRHLFRLGVSTTNLDKRIRHVADLCTSYLLRVDGASSLMFGPYAGFTPKFLKAGSWLDLFASIRPGNIIPLLAVFKDNLDLSWYLVTQLLASKRTKFAALREFMPEARPSDWYFITAGQRVQVIKKDAKKGGILQFGTEVVTGADGTIAGLLGASPGASTAVPIMFGLIDRCFPDLVDQWTPTLRAMVPSLGKSLSDSPALAEKTLGSTASALEIATTK